MVDVDEKRIYGPLMELNALFLPLGSCLTGEKKKY